VELVMQVEPEVFVLPPQGRQEVTVTIDAQVLGDREMDDVLRWTVEGNPRPDIPLNAAVRRGGILDRLLKR
jgi:hypothetical protein